MHARKQQRLNSTGSQKSGSQWKVKKSKPNETKGGARGRGKKKHIEGVAKQQLKQKQKQKQPHNLTR